MLILYRILRILLTCLIIRESWLGAVLILGKGNELRLKAGFPPLLRFEQFEKRLPSVLPGIKGEGEIQGFSIKGALPFSWPGGELIPWITC